MEDFTYKYYLLGNVTPVRVAFDRAGLAAGAEKIDRQTGELVIDNTLMSRIMESPEVEQIDKAEFGRRCFSAPRLNH